MSHKFLLILVITFLICPIPGSPDAQLQGSVAKLQDTLEKMADGINADWGIYVKNVTNGEQIAIQADKVMDTMSVIKIPIMVEAFRQAETGKFKLTDRLKWKDQDRRWGTGIMQTLDTGLQPTIKDVITLMITVSDNSATDMVLQTVGGPQNVNKTMQSYDLKTIVCHGTTYDWFRALAASMDPSYAKYGPEELFKKGFPESANYEKAMWAFHDQGKNPFGLSSARDIGVLLEKIVKGDAVSADASKQMLEIMRNQVYHTRIPKYLPGYGVPHKTGDFPPFIANDVGILEPGKMQVIFVAFSAHHRGIYPNLEDTIARMALEVFNFYNYRND